MATRRYYLCNEGSDRLTCWIQDLCNAALNFSYDTIRTGGHFICKFYQGAEEKALEMRLKALFAKVHREKPESSRSVSLVRRKRTELHTDS